MFRQREALTKRFSLEQSDFAQMNRGDTKEIMVLRRWEL